MKPLGRKQRISNQAWLDTVAQIKSLVSRSEIDRLAAETITDIKKKVGNRAAAYGWSGGKDSIVLGALCERAGITKSVLAVCDLEYPEFMQWLEDNKPAGCEIINTGLDLDWLAARPRLLFPQDSATAAPWFSNVQHKVQAEYFKNQNLDILVLGRRRADGNFVGRGTNLYTTKSGITRYSPLADWTHEHILAYIAYYKLELPPIYGWPNGYLCGTHPWPARQWTESIENGWREVYTIDPCIVAHAADRLKSAADFLEGVAA